MLEPATISVLLCISASFFRKLRRSQAKGQALAFEGEALRRQARLQETTDELTGLGNRRALMRALSTEFSLTPDAPQLWLVRIDVTGLRQYNEKFGCGAGDGLLARFGRNLGETFAQASAYRCAGAGFCVICRSDAYLSDEDLCLATAALCTGEDDLVGCSYGAVRTPSEAATASDALRLAEKRLHAHVKARPWDVWTSTHALASAQGEEGIGDPIANAQLKRPGGSGGIGLDVRADPWSEST